MTDYQLIRSKRKTISIEVTAEAAVVVRAPQRASRRLIDGFVDEKREWILRCQRQSLEKLRRRQRFAIADGSRLLFLGEEYPVSLLPGTAPSFDGSRFHLPEGGQEQIKRAAVAVYRALAKRVIPARVQEISRRTGLAASAVKINGAAKRWGSCSGTNSLNFSWRLVLAPPAAVDYVVVHELAHTLYHNHSTSFWKLVEKILPDYRLREEALRQLQQRLESEDWGERK